MNKYKIKRGTFKHIEDELYAYHETKKAISDIERMVIDETPDRLSMVGGRTNIPADPTANKAARVIEHKAKQQMTVIVSAIETVYIVLPDKQKELIRLKYWDRRLNDYGIQCKLGISSKTYYRWREYIIHRIAQILGWA